jgi:DNA replication initiation complex subunit (GINS family)
MDIQRTVTPDESRLAARILNSIENSDDYFKAKQLLQSGSFNEGATAQRKEILVEVARLSGETLAFWVKNTGYRVD